MPLSRTRRSLLAQALDEARLSGPSGAPRTVAPADSPDSTADLPPEARSRETPTVFHRLGRLAASPVDVITEEDTLEFFTTMQSESNRPNVLLDELKGSQRRLIGNPFPEWLARCFSRIAKSGRVSLQREELEIVADRRSRHDPGPVRFRPNFSCRTQLFGPGQAAEFVRELSAR